MYYITHTQTENAHFEADMFIFKYVCLQLVTTFGTFGVYVCAVYNEISKYHQVMFTADFISLMNWKTLYKTQRKISREPMAVDFDIMVAALTLKTI